MPWEWDDQSYYQNGWQGDWMWHDPDNDAGPYGPPGPPPGSPPANAAPAAPASAPAPGAASTLNYPKPQQVWDTLYGLDPVQQSRNLLGGLQGQVDPYFAQQASILGVPYGQQGGSGNQIAYQPLPGQPGYSGGAQPGFQPGQGAVSPFYQGAAGLYGNMLNQAGGSLGQAQGLLQNMGTEESFISSARPYIQDIMKSLGRSGLESSSLADRTVSNALGSLWAQNQLGLAQGWQGLAGQQQNLYGGAAQGLQGLGQGYQNLAGQYGQMGLNQANITGNLINSWQNMLSGVGNLGNLWYQPYNQMLGLLTTGGSVS
ncbi:MAG: hypothetical protein ACXABY_09705 [Candidatus Thorarchaeota archaeon]